MSEIYECPVCKSDYCGDGKKPCNDCEDAIKKLGCPSCTRLRELCRELWKRGSTLIYLNDADRYGELVQRLRDEGVVK